MKSDQPTQVDLGTDRSWEHDVAWVEAEVKAARERDAWKRFGTLGFEAYVEWVKANSAQPVYAPTE